MQPPPAVMARVTIVLKLQAGGAMRPRGAVTVVSAAIISPVGLLGTAPWHRPLPSYKA